MNTPETPQPAQPMTREQARRHVYAFACSYRLMRLKTMVIMPEQEGEAELYQAFGVLLDCPIPDTLEALTAQVNQ